MSALFAATVGATDYTGPLSVSLGGVATPSGDTTVSLTENEDGTCDLLLKNFSFSGLPVGNINMKNVAENKYSLVTTFKAAQDITIEAGDDASQTWFGPELGTLKVFAKGEVKNGKMNAVILIDMSNAEFGVIKVLFGDDAENLGQLPNSGMEGFHEEKYLTNKGMEPNAWHSFLCCDGQLKAFAATAHTEQASEARPGSTGTSSVKIFSKSVIGQSANGTITTGRITAGAGTAADAANHASADVTNSDKDSNGDPFYATLIGMPDSIEVWMKYQPKDEATTASISAVVTDGTYYQDPEDKTYTNVVAKAGSTAIAKNGGEWQLVKLPFDITSWTKNFPETGKPGDDAKSILVTISTCGVPGGGSTDSKTPDVLYVDDVRLVYGCSATNIIYNDKQLDGFSADKTEYAISGKESLDDFVKNSQNNIMVVSESYGTEGNLTVGMADDQKSVTAYYTLISGDYQNTKTYAITYTQESGETGIGKVENTTMKGNAVYDLSGRRVNFSDGQHGVYILRTAEGKTVKIYK